MDVDVVGTNGEACDKAEEMRELRDRDIDVEQNEVGGIRGRTKWDLVHSGNIGLYFTRIESDR